jgi:hypothetical protein
VAHKYAGYNIDVAYYVMGTLPITDSVNARLTFFSSEKALKLRAATHHLIDFTTICTYVARRWHINIHDTTMMTLIV